MAQTQRIPGLDGLRAAACLAVFAVHLQQMTGLGGKWGPLDSHRLLENGNTGVCLFFMLSGFLLSLPFWTQPAPPDLTHQHRGSRWLAGYTLRRLGRIIPAYYLCLTALIFMGRAQSVTDIALHYAFLHNLSETSLYSISNPFWTIAVQAQFYFVFALLMLALAPLSHRRGIVALLLIVGIAAAFFAHQAVFHAVADGRTWKAFSNAGSVVRVSTLAHLPHFMMGMLAAVIHVTLHARGMRGANGESAGRQPTDAASRPTLLPDAIALLAIAAILCVLAIPSLDDLLRLPAGAKDEQMIGRYNFPYIPLLVALLLILVPRTRILSRLFELPPILGLGVISYGIYVFHLPCLVLCGKILTAGKANATPNWIALAVMGLALAVIVSVISYLAVEKPIARWARGNDDDRRK